MHSTNPTLLIIDPRGSETAERLHAALADPDTALASEAVLSAIVQARQPCVIVGEIDASLLALAPLLVGKQPEDFAPLVVVNHNGELVVALLGPAAQRAQLARSVTNALVTATISTPCPAPHAGRVAVVGLGPGALELRAPIVTRELEQAQDILGYTTYVRMAGPLRADQRVLDSDNRCEMDRARMALDLAAQGRRVVVVSSGDPGVFAMAAAVVEALDEGDNPAWHSVDLAILPGISAAQAVAARAGAPLGHDFCILSLSDNLKPWSQIERRLEHAAAADLVIALYNPSSKARPWQLAQALELLRRHRTPTTAVVLGRDVGRPDERILTTTLGEIQPEQVDMRTLVIIGSSLTRRVPRADGKDWVYTPRWYPHATPDPTESM